MIDILEKQKLILFKEVHVYQCTTFKKKKQNKKNTLKTYRSNLRSFLCTCHLKSAGIVWYQASRLLHDFYKGHLQLTVILLKLPSPSRLCNNNKKFFLKLINLNCPAAKQKKYQFHQYQTAITSINRCYFRSNNKALIYNISCTLRPGDGGKGSEKKETTSSLMYSQKGLRVSCKIPFVLQLNKWNVLSFSIAINIWNKCIQKCYMCE